MKIKMKWVVVKSKKDANWCYPTDITTAKELCKENKDLYIEKEYLEINNNK